MMKLIIFGASGKTGRHMVAQTLAAGHEVTAFVRSPEAFSLEHERLAVVKGNALNKEETEAAINGHDAIASCLGGEGLGKSSVLTEMTVNILSGMKKHSVNRILYVASAGIHQEIPGITGFLTQKLILKNVLRDHADAVKRIRETEFDWTVARPMQLIDGPLTKNYRIAQEGIPEGGRKIARADVAHFLVKAWIQKGFIHTSAGLAY
ncbi:SDR family oxidoreductase [Metabacillus idriensis]|nr:NAD(P)-binding oxidoreductase [Metabacillus idriensis]MCM3598346.1 SDR family oxidoreductase [Metabacillus idriensis]